MIENLQGRTCRNCACMYLIEPPRVPTAEQLVADPNFANRKPVMICRLNPPAMLRFQMPSQVPGGPATIVDKLMQPQTDGYFSCWQWKAPGTLPGDALPCEGSLSVSVPGAVLA
jgi:hypothetical protein